MGHGDNLETQKEEQGEHWAEKMKGRGAQFMSLGCS